MNDEGLCVSYASDMQDELQTGHKSRSRFEASLEGQKFLFFGEWVVFALLMGKMNSLARRRWPLRRSWVPAAFPIFPKTGIRNRETPASATGQDPDAALPTGVPTPSG